MIKRHLLLVLIGVVHAIAAIALTIVAAAVVLDRYTSDTAFGTFMQLAPFVAIVLLCCAFPAYLLAKKRAGDAGIVILSALAGGVLTVYTLRSVASLCGLGGCMHL